MKKILSLIIGGVAVFSYGQELSYNQALDKMYGGNQKLKGIQKQKEASTFEEKTYKGLRLPQLSLNASYLHLSDPLSLNLNSARDRVGGNLAGLAGSPMFSPLVGRFLPLFQQDWSYEFQKADIVRVTADLKWVVFAGGKIKQAQKIGVLKTEIAQEEALKTEYALISELAERYFQTQLAQSAIKVREQALQSAKNHFENAQKLAKNGMVAQIETMQAEKAVTDAQRELLASQKDWELAQTALLGLMGEEAETFSELSTALFEVNLLQPLSFYQAKAKENYPTLVQARLKKEMAERNVKVQQSAYLPDVALIGKKYLYKSNLPITEPDNWYAGVGLQWNIFNGLQDKNRIAQAKATQESAELLTAQAERDIQTLVKKYYTEIEKQKEQLQSLEKSIHFAEELVRVRQKSFAEGFSTSTDVADAQLYLASIQIKRYQALFEMDKALAHLLEISGLSKEFVNYIQQ